MQPTPRLVRLAAALCLALTASACATPTYVTGASSSQDTIKFTYRQAKFFAPTEEGVIKCEVQPDGTLSYVEVLDNAGEQPDFDAILDALDGASE